MFQNRPRYLDELNRTMLITGVVLSLVGTLAFQYGTWPRYLCSGVAVVLLVLLVVRMTSRNQSARYQENMKFLTAVTAVKSWFQRTFHTSSVRSGPAKGRTTRAKKAHKNPSWSEMRQYKYLICPQCTQRLRVPRGKGRIRVTCTNCGNVFETKS